LAWASFAKNQCPSALTVTSWVKSRNKILNSVVVRTELALSPDNLELAWAVNFHDNSEEQRLLQEN